MPNTTWVNLIELAKTDPAAAKTLANVRARAARLFTAAGYRCTPSFTVQGYYHVTKPGGVSFLVTPPLSFEIRERRLLPGALRCVCIFWKENCTCKHALAVEALLADQAAQEAAQVAEYEAHQAMIDAAEHPEFGCDPYPEF